MSFRQSLSLKFKRTKKREKDEEEKEEKRRRRGKGRNVSEILNWTNGCPFKLKTMKKKWLPIFSFLYCSSILPPLGNSVPPEIVSSRQRKWFISQFLEATFNPVHSAHTWLCFPIKSRQLSSPSNTKEAASFSRYGASLTRNLLQTPDKCARIHLRTWASCRAMVCAQLAYWANWNYNWIACFVKMCCFSSVYE